MWADLRSSSGDTNGTTCLMTTGGQLVTTQVALFQLFLVLGLPCILFSLCRWSRARALGSRRLPPSPPALPFIGHLHLLTKLPHKGLQRIARKYGHLVRLRLGRVNVVVATSPAIARDVLKNQDVKFASRPGLETTKVISYDFMGIGFTPYGEHWRYVRKICVLELLNPKTLDGFRGMRKEEVSILVRGLWRSSQRSEFVELRPMLWNCLFNVITRMLMSQAFFGPGATDAVGAAEFLRATDEVNILLGKFNIRDYFPSLRWFDPSVSQMVHLHKAVDTFLQNVVDEHRQQDSSSKKIKDFCDILLDMLAEHSINKQNTICKALLQDLLVAGSDASIAAIEWSMAELFQHPEVVSKLQKEMEMVVGSERMIEESDIPKLPYLNAIVKEVFRLHPPAPLLIPHESLEDCELQGYFIPGGTRVFINVYAIGRDPYLWEKPLEFLPERFMGSKLDVRGHDFELIPFGSGRRGCPGHPMALTMIQLTVGNLLHGFNWELPCGSPSMAEHFGLVMSMASPLRARPSPRLPMHNMGG